MLPDTISDLYKDALYITVVSCVIGEISFKTFATTTLRIVRYFDHSEVTNLRNSGIAIKYF